MKREHREQRRVLLRGVLDNKTPYDTFVEKFGEPGKKLLNALGIVKIPPNEVTLDPMLLREKLGKEQREVVTAAIAESVRRSAVFSPVPKSREIGSPSCAKCCAQEPGTQGLIV